MRTLLSVAMTLIAATAALGADPTGAVPKHWGYTGAVGPDHWGDLESDFSLCAQGHHQSPIDIRDAHPSDLAAIEFDYKPAELHVVDNGHTIMVNVGAGSSILVDGRRFALTQFHFHKPSEERVQGKSYAMVAHLVHKDEQGHLAVVAVLLSPGASNRLIEKIWSHLPKEREKEWVVPEVRIDAAELLPTDRGYYTFEGSLTTPPCTEGVTWFVLKTPTTVSASQVARFGRIYSANARPVQPLYDRVVKVSR